VGVFWVGACWVCGVLFLWGFFFFLVSGLYSGWRCVVVGAGLVFFWGGFFFFNNFFFWLWGLVVGALVFSFFFLSLFWGGFLVCVLVLGFVFLVWCFVVFFVFWLWGFYPFGFFLFLGGWVFLEGAVFCFFFVGGLHGSLPAPSARGGV